MPKNVFKYKTKKNDLQFNLTVFICMHFMICTCNCTVSVSQYLGSFDLPKNGVVYQFVNTVFMYADLFKCDSCLGHSINLHMTLKQQTLSDNLLH